MNGKRIVLALGTAMLFACAEELPTTEMQAQTPGEDDVGDLDEDGMSDSTDNCPSLPNPGQDDVDGDQVGDDCDVCPQVANPEQGDEDEDGTGDVCEGEERPMMDTDLTPLPPVFPDIDRSVPRR